MSRVDVRDGWRGSSFSIQYGDWYPAEPCLKVLQSSMRLCDSSGAGLALRSAPGRWRGKGQARRGNAAPHIADHTLPNYAPGERE